ncbi:hypothetical protein [Desulforhopalus singaporensis]|uniref:Uncharacterized protein n=1 Tax=Desulforhopalus singaporensis TaxID=91360 RepID=A0A1H0PC77_9BACT|nr:hypothetical protein [Desulforhopalus singaporensis]SDP02717.1 hypothetical protein SAMN05660330_01612 [Desulforhopalus singaporensis]
MEIFSKIADWFIATHIHEQIMEVDFTGLFTNPWFMVPFVTLVIYMLYKQRWKDMIIIGLCIGVWYVSGTPYMNSLIRNGEIQIDKILPVVFGGAAVLGLIIYLLFGRSD